MKKRVLTAAIAAMCFVGTAPVSAVPITGVAENLQEQTVLTENDDAVTTTIAVTGTQPVTTITMPVVDDPTMQISVVTVTIMDINGDIVLVKPVDGSPELKSSSKFSLSAKQLSADINPKVGMKLKVTYSGGILETYPAQFGNVQKVTIVSETANNKEAQKPLISEDDILELSKKGDELTWSDFEKYEFTDVGDGTNIWQFVIKNSGSKLLVIGRNLKEKPEHINCVWGNGAEFDIRTEDLTPWFYDGAITTTIAVTETKPVTTITIPVLDDPTIQTEVVTVTVMDVSGDNILVKPVEDSPEFKSSEKLFLSKKKLPDDIKPKVGMKLEITYKGGILVTFPGQFANVQKVVEVKDDTVKEDPTLLKGTKEMTLNDVMRLAELGDELDWADFKDYNGKDVGSGLYIWEFTLEDGYVLDVGGTTDKKPLYILLSHEGDKGIDIRTNDVKEYIASTATPVVDDPSIMTSDYTMTVTVIEINGSSLLVKNVESSGDVLTLPANKLDNGIKPVVGMKLEVTYNGGILEDYPAMFGNIQKVTVLSETTEIVAGDANCDGSVDMADAVMIMQALANPNKYGINGTAEHHLTEQGKLNGDMDGDGLTVGDAQAIQRKLLGLDSESSEIEPELGDIVSIKTPYRPAMSDWSGIGILLEFDSSDYQITLFAEDGHFTYWDINKGSGPIKDVGTTYEVGKNGYIFWSPDDLKYPEDFETEIIVKGTSSNKSVELGRIYVTRGERSTLIASLEKPDSAIDPMQPEIQPLGVGGIDEAITLISNYDLNKYDKIYHDSYKKMFERFKNDGFIYQVTENETIKENNNRGVALFPYAKYEDIGVGYYVTFKEKNYHIMFYYADAEVLTETEGIAEYLKKRMGRSSDKIVKIQDKDVSLLFPENGQCYANAFIDENHYFDIIGAVSEDELIEFLNAFEYGKLNLKSDKRLKLIDNTIKSVNVTSLPKGYDFTFTDSKAQKFIDFLSDMELTDDFSEDPGQLNGMTWVIKLEYQNNETMTLYDIGGYIMSENDSWLKYEYDYDSPLDTLIWELSK